jgi:hypothetical protein
MKEVWMTDRSTKERKLMALMISDLELNLEEAEMIEVEQEVRSLPNEELDRTLASRLDLPYPVDEQEMGRALGRIEVPTRLQRSLPPCESLTVDH